ncbi:MAG: ribosome maturation factor [Chitinophagaceae bacterium]|nr:ribosome maturation factor [Chitinophagaceae bacterium]MCW5904407.1 ribosome maturation factor [Chitinophagaceae bacterium]
MPSNTQLQTIEQLLHGLLQDEPTYFLVQLRIKPTNNIKIFLDGDNGITIEKCISFNRKLYKLIEEAGLFSDGDYSLEVSSPGVGEPLKLHRQYVKNIGRCIEIVFNDDTKKEGKLLTVTDDTITIEYTEGKGKKAITQQNVISFTNIKTTTVQIKF